MCKNKIHFIENHNLIINIQVREEKYAPTIKYIPIRNLTGTLKITSIL